MSLVNSELEYLIAGMYKFVCWSSQFDLFSFNLMYIIIDHVEIGPIVLLDVFVDIDKKVI